MLATMRLQYTYTSSSWLRNQLIAIFLIIAVGALFFTLSLHQALLLGGTTYLVFGAGVAVGSAPFLYKAVSQRRNEYGTMLVNNPTALITAKKRMRAARWIIAPLAIIIVSIADSMPSSAHIFLESILGGACIAMGMIPGYQLLRHRHEIERLARETSGLVDVEAKKPAARKSE